MSVAQFETMIKPKVGRTLIVGSRIYLEKEDRRKRYADVVGVDMSSGPGVDMVADLETDHVGIFSHIECMSVLEHCKRPWMMAENLQNMLEPEGTLFVTVPFVWKIHGYPDDYWRFTLSGIKQLFQRIKWKAQAYAVHDKLLLESPAARVNDWPHHATAEACSFGMLA